MSERPEGVPEGVVPRLRDSAVVILARKNAAGEWEVLMGLRSRRSAFFPSAWAFPGGAVEPADQPHLHGAHARCGVRELREETGVSISPDRLFPIGTKTTPPFHPIRHRTEFFVALASPGVKLPPAPPAPGENEELRFVAAREALEAWERGEMLFPPLPPLLRVFARERSSRFEELPRLLTVVSDYEERVPRIEFVPGAWMYPVTSNTLPPATHTNVWLTGHRRMVIVDPGASEHYDLEHLTLVIERRARMGSAPLAILLTHHHRDHTDGAAWLADRFGVPIRAHAETARLLEARGFERPVRGDIEDGAELDLGGLTLVARHTPGHAPGHLVFEIPERRAALIGDLLSGFSTILVHPDDGDMGQYLESLRRVRGLDIQVLLPAHGPPLAPGALDAALDHRLQRDAAVRAALTSTPRPLAEIAALAYLDTPGAHPILAALQTRAHLQRLERAGEAQRDDGPEPLWSLAAPAPPAAETPPAPEGPPAS